MSQQERRFITIPSLIFVLVPCFGQQINHTLGSTLFFESKAGYVSMTRDAKAYFLRDHVVYKIRDLNFHMEFLGASRHIDPRGEEPQATLVNYLVGNREQDWSTNLPTYKALAYHGVYPGIDVRFGFSGSHLKSEFVVAPGGDPSLVRVRYSGLGSPHIEENGDLKFLSERGEFREALPAVYQMDGARHIDVPAKYKIWDDGGIGFELGAFDETLPLIIDPLVVYSSYFGVHGDTSATGVAVDSNGNAYVTGWTDSMDLPVAGPLQGFNAGNVDAFVMKLNSAGNTLLYATYIGGTGDDRAYGIAVDSGGNAYITGTTTSTNFPTKAPLQSGLSGSRDAFVLKLNAAGNGLTFSTFLGGAGSETGYGIALDTQANAYVTGDTTSSNFPTRTPFQASLNGAQDAFVTKISSAGALVYSTYLGGTASEHGAAIAVDAAGDAYVTGGTFSTNFPTLSAFQAANAGGQDAFVTKLAPGGNSLIYSSYLGGSGGALGSVEWGAGIALDAQGRATVVGATSSSNFPVVAPFQPAPGGGLVSAFIAQFTLPGTGLRFSTYFGGSTADYGQAIAIDLAGNVYVTGFTGSLDIPIVASAQATAGGGYDAFALIVSPTWSLLFSTYYGGSGSDSGNAIAVDPSGNVVVAGQTTSANFPITGGIQSVMLGSIEAFVVKLHPGLAQPDFSLSMSPNPATVAAGGTGSYTVTSAGVNGFSGSVSLAVSGLPSGVTGSFNPVSIAGSGSSTLTITATSGATVGSSTTTVTGTSGNLTHNTSATLNVTAGTSAVATFVKQDTTTQGSWKGVYGGDGYIVIGDQTSNPSYVTPVASGQSQVSWTNSTNDVRALQKASNPADRIAGVWYSFTSFSVDLNNTDTNTHQVAVYCVDWDRLGRNQKVDILDANGNVLNTQSLTSFGNGVYLVWTVSGHVKIRVTLVSGGNAVMTGIFFGTNVASSGTASFVKLDTTTQGSWKGVYGGDGYIVIGDQTSNPSYVTPVASGQSQVSWTNSTNDVRALQKASNPADRIAGVWYSFTSFSVDLNNTDTNPHQVAVYCVDWDRLGRNQKVDILDANGNVLNTQSLTSFGNGVYLVWTVSGHVKIRVSLVSGGNAVMTGIFFGTNVTASGTASFVKLDTTTQGSWKGVYGASGYVVVGDQTSNPSYVTPVASGQSQVSWTNSTNDVRALQKASNPADRIAGVWFSSTSFSVDLNNTGSGTHEIAVYCVDWDRLGRSQKVDILDNSGNVLNSQSLANFGNGVYLVWNVTGHVKLRVTLVSGGNGVLTGLFFH